MRDFCHIFPSHRRHCFANFSFFFISGGAGGRKKNAMQKRITKQFRETQRNSTIKALHLSTNHHEFMIKCDSDESVCVCAANQCAVFWNPESLKCIKQNELISIFAANILPFPFSVYLFCGSCVCVFEVACLWAILFFASSPLTLACLYGNWCLDLDVSNFLPRMTTTPTTTTTKRISTAWWCGSYSATQRKRGSDKDGLQVRGIWDRFAWALTEAI